LLGGRTAALALDDQLAAGGADVTPAALANETTTPASRQDFANGPLVETLEGMPGAALRG
jgi:hypothetical protein